MALMDVQGAEASGEADFSNPVKVGGVFNTTKPTIATGQRADFQADQNGNARAKMVAKQAGAADGFPNTSTGFVVAEASDTNNLLLLIAPYSFNGTSWDRTSKASTVARLPSAAATTNATSAKGSAGTVYSIECLNASAAVKYLKLYNKASAPTVGTDTPFRTIALPPSNARTAIHFPTGLYFSTGIAYALTGAAADADTTALTLADVVGLNIDYS